MYQKFCLKIFFETRFIVLEIKQQLHDYQNLWLIYFDNIHENRKFLFVIPHVSEFQFVSNIPLYLQVLKKNT